MKNYVKIKKKLKTQGKNSKLKVKTQKVGTFRIPGSRKSVQKKAWFTYIVKPDDFVDFGIWVYFAFEVHIISLFDVFRNKILAKTQEHLWGNWNEK